MFKQINSYKTRTQLTPVLSKKSKSSISAKDSEAIQQIPKDFQSRRIFKLVKNRLNDTPHSDVDISFGNSEA